MKLWLLSQEVNSRWDTFDSCVVAADTEAAARLIHPYGEKEQWDGKVWRSSPHWTDDTWATPDVVKVTEIGIAADGITGVVCASFNAG